MEIKDRVSGKVHSIVIAVIQEGEWSLLTKKRYSFTWKRIKDITEVYLLRKVESDDVLGVMAIKDFQDEARIEIGLIAASVENQGHNKEFEGIPGCLIAFACRLGLTRYGYLACVSLVPKTRLKMHYINQYGMVDAGKQVFLDGRELLNIIKKFKA